MRRLVCITLLLIAVALATRVAAQEKEHPIVAAVKASLKDTNQPFSLLIHATVKDGTASKLESAFAKARIETRKEKGNRAYDLNRSVKDANEFVVYERWQNLASLEDHLKAPHTTKLLTTIGALLAGPPDVKVLVPAGE